MQEVADRINIASSTDSCLVALNKGYVVVHACKDPCHRQACGNYKGSLPATDPNYLYKEVGENNLNLNLIDPPVPLFKIESFKKFLDWTVPRYEKGQPIFIHCNKNESRAPSLAMVLMNKVGKLGDTGSVDNFDAALAAMIKIYPNYQPGQGIQAFLREHWQEL